MRNCTIGVAKTKALISFTVTAHMQSVGFLMWLALKSWVRLRNLIDMSILLHCCSFRRQRLMVPVTFSYKNISITENSFGFYLYSLRSSPKWNIGILR